MLKKKKKTSWITWEKYCLRPLNKTTRKSGKKNEAWHKILEISVNVSYYLIVFYGCIAFALSITNARWLYCWSCLHLGLCVFTCINTWFFLNVCKHFQNFMKSYLTAKE